MAVLVLAAASPASARIAGKVAFVHDGKVLVKQTATPSVRAVQVSGSVPARWVAITQSGAKVVWSAQNTAVAVRVRPSTASRRTKLFTFPGSASSVTPAWFGASGLRIGFIASRYTNDGSAPRDRIGWMNGDGTGARLVFDAPPGSIDARKLSWTGNGMLFAMRPAGSSFRNLYAYQPGSDTLTRITNAEAAGHTSYSQAVWSRGGRTIAAVVDGRLVVMDADGTNQRVGPAGRAPAFSPDGTTLAYIRVTDGRVRAISLDFSFERALVSNTATDISW
jgi:hypothetical protein